MKSYIAANKIISRRFTFEKLIIEGIDIELSKRIKAGASRNNESINQTVIKILRPALVMSKTPRFKTYHDLDHLAGGWTEEDEREFYKGVSDFRKL